MAPTSAKPKVATSPSCQTTAISEQARWVIERSLRHIAFINQEIEQVMQRLAQSFSDQRSNLEKQWDAAEKVSTEELRIALQRYRSFFERLLAV